MKLLNLQKKKHVIFLSIPPHISNKLQPLDVAVYGPIKFFLEFEVNTFQKQHPGRIIKSLINMTLRKFLQGLI